MVRAEVEQCMARAYAEQCIHPFKVEEADQSRH
jgi:hypothetical protein